MFKNLLRAFTIDGCQINIKERSIFKFKI